MIFFAHHLYRMMMTVVAVSILGGCCHRCALAVCLVCLMRMLVRRESLWYLLVLYRQTKAAEFLVWIGQSLSKAGDSYRGVALLAGGRM